MYFKRITNPEAQKEGFFNVSETPCGNYYIYNFNCIVSKEGILLDKNTKRYYKIWDYSWFQIPAFDIYENRYAIETTIEQWGGIQKACSRGIREYLKIIHPCNNAMRKLQDMAYSGKFIEEEIIDIFENIPLHFKCIDLDLITFFTYSKLDVKLSHSLELGDFILPKNESPSLLYKGFKINKVFKDLKFYSANNQMILG